MKELTIRGVLGKNFGQGVQPANVSQLVRASGVARETIEKMLDGDYSRVTYSSIVKVWAALGYRVMVGVEKVGGG